MPVLPVKNEITLTEGKLSVLLIVYLRYSGGPSELQLRAVDAHSSCSVAFLTNFLMWFLRDIFFLKAIIMKESKKLITLHSKILRI